MGRSALPKYASHQAQENIRDIFGLKPIGIPQELGQKLEYSVILYVYYRVETCNYFGILESSEHLTKCTSSKLSLSLDMVLIVFTDHFPTNQDDFDVAKCGSKKHWEPANAWGVPVSISRLADVAILNRSRGTLHSVEFTGAFVAINQTVYHLFVVKDVHSVLDIHIHCLRLRTVTPTDQLGTTPS